MTNATAKLAQDLSDQDLDSVLGGVKVEMGPIHLRFDSDFFGFGVGNAGFWMDRDGFAGAHVGSLGGMIG